MGENKHSVLCVGGPMDGERVNAQAKFFRVQVRTDLPEAPVGKVSPTSYFDETIYVREKFSTPALDIDVWRPQTQTVEETLEMLIGGYRKGHRGGLQSRGGE